MLTPRYAYAYAVIRASDGRCKAVDDTSVYIEDRLYIPLDYYEPEYLGKYYYPIPTEYGDFNGSWYYDANHTRPFDPSDVV